MVIKRNTVPMLIGLNNHNKECINACDEKEKYGSNKQ